MTFDDKLKELEYIEQNNLPKTYDELLSKIDHYIYNCELGFEKALELCMIAFMERAAAEKEYKMLFAVKFLDGKDAKVPVTILKEFTRSKCYKENGVVIDTELLKQIADYHKIKWEEKLNVYKKIKNARF